MSSSRIIRGIINDYSNMVKEAYEMMIAKISDQFEIEIYWYYSLTLFHNAGLKNQAFVILKRMF